MLIVTRKVPCSSLDLINKLLTIPFDTLMSILIGQACFLDAKPFQMLQKISVATFSGYFYLMFVPEFGKNWLYVMLVHAEGTNMFICTRSTYEGAIGNVCVC